MDVVWKTRTLDAPVTAGSFDGHHILLITDAQTGYIFDTELEQCQAPMDLRRLTRIEDLVVTACGIWSNFIVLGDDGGNFVLLDLSSPREVKHLHRSTEERGDLSSVVTMNSEFILAGTEKGFAGIWDYDCRRLFHFKASGFINYVSARGHKILIEEGPSLYVWADFKNREQYTTDDWPHLVWATFNPFGPALVLGHWDKENEVAYPPILKSSYGPEGREYYATHVRDRKRIEIRDLSSSQVLHQIPISDQPYRVWMDWKHLFLVTESRDIVQVTGLSLELNTDGTYSESLPLLEIEA